MSDEREKFVAVPLNLLLAVLSQATSDSEAVETEFSSYPEDAKKFAAQRQRIDELYSWIPTSFVSQADGN